MVGASVRKGKGRAVCRPPVGLRTRFCLALDNILVGTNERRAGVHVVQLTTFARRSSSERVVGVAARRSAKDRPIMFNNCPFCGTAILWFKKKGSGR